MIPLYKGWMKYNAWKNKALAEAILCKFEAEPACHGGDGAVLACFGMAPLFWHPQRAVYLSE